MKEGECGGLVFSVESLLRVSEPRFVLLGFDALVGGGGQCRL